MFRTNDFAFPGLERPQATRNPLTRSRFLFLVRILSAALVVACTAGATQTLTSLTWFTPDYGINPYGGLIADANGNLYGATTSGGAYNSSGTVYEIPKTPDGYNPTPIVLASFDGTNEAYSYSTLVADASGNLFGTTLYDYGSGCGTAFEIKKDSTFSTGYNSAPIILHTFSRTDGCNPKAGLIADAIGNLYGTAASGGPSGFGTVFELTKDSGSPTGYDAAIVLASFSRDTGVSLTGRLIADANGNLFGTASNGGPNHTYPFGTVYEVQKDSSFPNGFNPVPVVLASFSGADGSNPTGVLTFDGAGNLFGVTTRGGSTYTGIPGAGYGYGTVFEIQKTKNGYNSTPIVLTSFNGTNGQLPNGGLISDALGNLFGATYTGGQANFGTVFEIRKNPTAANGYDSTPILVENFTGNDQGTMYDSLLPDANGNLFGTSYFAASGWGSAFELSGTGFVVQTFSTFTPKLEVGQTGFQLSATVTLANGATTFNPAQQSMALSIGSYSVSLPAGSLLTRNTGTYVYSGVINGMTLQIRISKSGTNSYLIQVDASGVALPKLSNPALLTLTLGPAGGVTTVKP